ncbi:MAG: response regulator [Muribaculaceae bacterium]|nr:response regulator [Muribaculaceae bacterium]
MATGINSDILRLKVLRLAQLDWFIANLNTKEVTIGEILQETLKLKTNCFSFVEGIELLNNEAKDMVRNYGQFIANNSKKNITLHLNDLLFPDKSMYVEVANFNEAEGVLEGYIHIKPREAGVSQEIINISTTQKEREAFKMRSAFLATMSHELRTPINAIVGFSKVLATATDPEAKEEYLHIIENNNEMLLQLINDILDLSKIDSDTLDLRLANIDLKIFMSDVRNNIKVYKINPNVTVSIDIPEDSYAVRTDKIRLMQVVTNFITNAIKFTVKGKINIGYEYNDDTFKIFVKDTGPGIPIDQQKTIFDRFVRLNTRIKGNGLGLSICTSIAEKLGAEIGVESSYGEGSKFWISIPDVKLEAPVRIKAEQDALVRGSSKDQRIKVLVAEDDPSNYKLCEVLLKPSYDIIHAWDGKEAIEKFKSENPDIILMDLNMPEVNGYEATEQIRKLSWTVPIIALTAYTLANDEHKVLQSGFDAYLTKPIDISKLKETLLASQRQEKP